MTLARVSTKLQSANLTFAIAFALAAGVTGCKPDVAITADRPVNQPGMAAATSAQVPAGLSGTWQPLSTSATAITGPVTLSASSITIAGRSYPLAGVQALSVADAANVNGALNLVMEAPTAGFIAQTSIAASAPMLNGNTMCSSAATWVVGVTTAGPQRGLGLAFFTGSAKPQLSKDFLANTSTLCGTFSY